MIKGGWIGGGNVPNFSIIDPFTVSAKHSRKSSKEVSHSVAIVASQKSSNRSKSHTANSARSNKSHASIPIEEDETSSGILVAETEDGLDNKESDKEKGASAMDNAAANGKQRGRGRSCTH